MTCWSTFDGKRFVGATDKTLALAVLRAYNDWHIHIGIETIAWECDYPHSDSTWPRSPEELGRSLAGVPEDEVRLVTHVNAMRAPNEPVTMGDAFNQLAASLQG